MADTPLTIQIDEQLKEKAEIFFYEKGLNLSKAVNDIIERIVEEDKTTIDEQIIDDFFNEKTLLEMRASLKEINEGEIFKISMDDLMAEEL